MRSARCHRLRHCHRRRQHPPRKPPALHLPRPAGWLPLPPAKPGRAAAAAPPVGWGAAARTPCCLWNCRPETWETPPPPAPRSPPPPAGSRLPALPARPPAVQALPGRASGPRDRPQRPPLRPRPRTPAQLGRLAVCWPAHRPSRPARRTRRPRRRRRWCCRRRCRCRCCHRFRQSRGACEAPARPCLRRRGRLPAAQRRCRRPSAHAQRSHPRCRRRRRRRRCHGHGHRLRRRGRRHHRQSCRPRRRRASAQPRRLRRRPAEQGPGWTGPSFAPAASLMPRPPFCPRPTAHRPCAARSRSRRRRRCGASPCGARRFRCYRTRCGGFASTRESGTGWRRLCGQQQPRPCCWPRFVAPLRTPRGQTSCPLGAREGEQGPAAPCPGPRPWAPAGPPSPSSPCPKGALAGTGSAAPAAREQAGPEAPAWGSRETAGAFQPRTRAGQPCDRGPPPEGPPRGKGPPRGPVRT
mmetsp:Transcript_3682/g.15292  ORF Transcript_3682/g.15292 Transcript_3682/m.15292 type:complete len:467 (+) Transcript_3682:745-2145(+)